MYVEDLVARMRFITRLGRAPNARLARLRPVNAGVAVGHQNAGEGH